MTLGFTPRAPAIGVGCVAIMFGGPPVIPFGFSVGALLIVTSAICRLNVLISDRRVLPSEVMGGLGEVAEARCLAGTPTADPEMERSAPGVGSVERFADQAANCCGCC